MARFWTSVILFHCALVPVTVGIGRRWARRLACPMPTLAWASELARAAGLFAAALLLAGIAAAVAPRAGFTLLRLWCQGIFGEGVLLALWLTFLHGRAGRLLRGAVPGLAAAALLCAYVEAYHLEPHDLQVRHHALDLSRGAGAARRLRILHLTDIQTPEVGAYEEHAIREGLAQRPDLIVLTGDYVHERFSPTRARATADLRQLFRRLAYGARLGVFAVRGDTDRDWPAVFAGLDVRCLVNEKAAVPLPGGGTLEIVGLSPAASHARDGARTLRLLEPAPPEGLRIVIAHAPDFVMQVAGRARIDLVLAGHTHGGQVALPLIGPLWTSSRLPRRYAGDLHDYAGIPLHVSRGVGMERGTAPQIRFLCPPEICVIDVRYDALSASAAGPARGPGAPASAPRPSDSR